MKDMLMNLPKEIKIKRFALVSKSLSIESITTSVKEWETEQLEDISNTLKDGKPAFSNAEKRVAEMARRKKELPWMVELENQLTELRSSYEIDRIYLQYSIDVQENYRAIARLGGGE
jgi:hypothetical protein